MSLRRKHPAGSVTSAGGTMCGTRSTGARATRRLDESESGVTSGSFRVYHV